MTDKTSTSATEATLLQVCSNGGLGRARERVSLLGAGEHVDTVNAALDALPHAIVLLAECERTLEMWADVAPAVSLRADIRKLLGSVA